MSSAQQHVAPRLRWWHEVGAAAAFYAIYTLVRDVQGSAAVSYHRALRDAQDVIAVERSLDLFHERAIQHLVLNQRAFIIAANVFYGSLHFIVTVGVLVVVYRRSPATYRRARNTLAATTALALIGFALFPTAPPRLLPPQYGFVDTLARYGGLWSFDSTSMARLSNQYAAMPSLHIAWALWAAVAIAPVLPTKTARVAVFAYPALTLAVIVTTANHYFLDAAFGAITLLIGINVAATYDATLNRRRVRPQVAVEHADK